MEREALMLDAQAAAMAARNSNGLVIAQVERIAAHGSLDARQVVVPGVLVDCVVLAPGKRAPADLRHRLQRRLLRRDPRAARTALPAAPLDERKLIARRCAFELPLGGVVNLGIGVPEVVAAVAAEERVLDHLTLTAEPGVIGGMPQGGLDFGAAVNTQALLHQNQQFDFYDGGGLDLACLGMAEVDRSGNVNVSRFGPRLAGAGGFINISQNARRLVFAGTFTAGGLEVVEIADGKVRISTRRQSAQVRRCGRADHLQRPSGGAQAASRCTTSPSAASSSSSREGLHLIEVAPGIDIERDILAHMAFQPLIGDVRDDGRAHLPPEADGALGHAAGSATRRSPQLRRRAQHAVRQLRGHEHPQHGRHRQRASRVRRAVQQGRPQGCA